MGFPLVYCPYPRLAYGSLGATGAYGALGFWLRALKSGKPMGY